jgi:hypothetical protein
MVARDLAESELRPHAAQWDETETFPERSWDLLREAGLLGLTMPTEFGGSGHGVLEACIVIEEIARGCLASAMALQMNVNGPPRAILSLGSDDQRRRYLPGACDGSRYFAIAMTEPQAGSDGLNLQTTLSSDGSGFRLSGTKCFITGGARADTYLVFCRAPDTVGTRGIGAVLVERGQPGFAEPIIERKMGGGGVAEAELHFDGVSIESDAVLIVPDAESKRGAEILLTQFNPERCGNAAMAIGVAQAAFDDSVQFARTREQFGRPIAEFQGISWKLADMGVDIEAARMLTWRAAATLDDDGFPLTLPTAMAKLFASEMVQRVTSHAVQIHGHRGYSKGFPIERYFREGRGFSIGGGTSEILRNMIAGDLTGVRVPQRRMPT